MGVFDVPKALYKANQAKKKMSKIQAAGSDGAVSVLVNGVSEVIEVELDVDMLLEMLEMEIERAKIEKLAAKLAQNIKNALNNSKKQLEQELVKSTDINELKSMLGM